MEKHKFFYNSGFKIDGIEQILYKENQSITFIENDNIFTLGFNNYETIWNFYNSTGNTLIKSVTGTTAVTTSFTYNEGKNGIDVELIINFGIHTTKFKKRHRIVIMRDKATPTRTIILNQLPRYGGGTAFTVDSNVTNSSNIITTTGAHGISVDSILLFTQGGTDYTYRALLGTSGSTIIIEQPFQGTTGTITQFNAYYGNNIDLIIDGTSWSAGDIVNLTGMVYCNRFAIRNINGTSANPIQISIPDGDTHVTMTKQSLTYINDDILSLIDNINHVHFYFDKDSSGNRKFELIDGGFSTNHFATGDVYGYANVRFSGFDIYNAISSAMKLKVDSNSRAVGGLDDCWVFDNYWDTSFRESLYFGYFTYGYVTTKYYPAHKRAKIWGNTSLNTQWDGIQVACADEDTEVHDNFADNNGLENTGSQNFSYSINEGFKGYFYNNIAGRQIQLQPFGTTYIYNNFIRGTNEEFAIFIRRTDNPMLGSPSYITCDPTADLYVFNNTLLCAKDCLYLLDANDDSTGSISFNDIHYFNNTLNYTGVPNADGEYRDAGGGTNVIVSNFKPALESQISIVDKSNLDIDLNQDSEVFFSGNTGNDVSLYILQDNLPLKSYTDISGRNIPDRGYWKQSHIHRPVGFNDQIYQSGKTSIQWYQTNYADYIKLPDYFGGTVKTSNLITTSSYTALTASILPAAKTGIKYGTETFQTVVYYFPILGQSQAGAYLASPALTTVSVENVQTLTNGPIDASTVGNLIPLVEGDNFTDTNGGGASPNVETIATSLLQQLKTYRNYKPSDIYVATVHARGGETIQALSKSGSTGRFEEIITTVNRLKTICDTNGYKLIANPIFFHGGTGDNAGGTYESKLIDLYNDFETDIKAITDQSDVYLFTHQQRVIGSPDYGIQQDSASLTEPNIIVVSPEYKTTYQGDNVHLTNHGTRYLAMQWSRAIYYQLFRSGFAPLRLDITGATFNDVDKITIPVINGVGNLVSTSNCGIQVYNNDTSSVESSTTTVSGSSLIVTLTSPPSGLTSLTIRTAIPANGELKDSSNDTVSFLNASSAPYDIAKYMVRQQYDIELEFPEPPPTPFNIILNFGGNTNTGYPPDVDGTTSIYTTGLDQTPVIFNIGGGKSVILNNSATNYFGFTQPGSDFSAGKETLTGSGQYANDVIGSWVFTDGNRSADIIFSGLTTGVSYTFKVGGFRPNSGTARSTHFTIDGTTITRTNNWTGTDNQADNDSQFAIFTGVVPESDTTVTLTVQSNGTTFGYISVVEITEE